MTRFICLLGALFLILTHPALAREPLEITWEDLIPEDEEPFDPNNVDHDGNRPLFEDPAGDTAGGMGDPFGDPMLGDPMGGDMSGFPPIQYGSFETVPELDGQYIKMPGFGLALEFSSKGQVDEFLLVPYFGACVHVPPPPPNQTVYITAEETVNLKGMWDPIWVYGTLRAKRNDTDLANAAYTLELEKIEPYDE